MDAIFYWEWLPVPKAEFNVLAMIAEQGIFANATVAEKAIPKCNVCYMDGEAMKNAMKVYIEILYGINPKAVGGALPADDFYYMGN